MTDTNKAAMQQQQQDVSSDIIAFCELIARIMMRCLREKDPHVMEMLSLSSKLEEAGTGENHDAV